MCVHRWPFTTPWSPEHSQYRHSSACINTDHTHEHTLTLFLHCSADMCTNTCSLTWWETCALLRSELCGLWNSRFQLTAWSKGCPAVETRSVATLREKLGAVIQQLNQLRFWSERQSGDSLSFQQIRTPALLIKTHFFSIVHYDSGAEQQMKWIIIQRFTDTVVWETMWYDAFFVLNQSAVTAASDVFAFILSLPAHCC